MLRGCTRDVATAAGVVVYLVGWWARVGSEKSLSSGKQLFLGASSGAPFSRTPAVARPARAEKCEDKDQFRSVWHIPTSHRKAFPMSSNYFLCGLVSVYVHCTAGIK